MVAIRDLIEKGFKCPDCGSQEIRACYHDWQSRDSFVCEKCGLRWIEDVCNAENIHILMLTEEEWSTRFIWVLHVANRFDTPLKNSESADESDSIRDFKKKGLPDIKHPQPECDEGRMEGFKDSL